MKTSTSSLTGAGCGIRNGDLGERLTYCDADSRGVWVGANGWCELNGAPMALELPGVCRRTNSFDSPGGSQGDFP